MIKSGVTVTSLQSGKYKVIVEIDKVFDIGLNSCIGSTIIELPNEYNSLVTEIERAVKRTINKYNKTNVTNEKIYNSNEGV